MSTDRWKKEELSSGFGAVWVGEADDITEVNCDVQSRDGNIPLRELLSFIKNIVKRIQIGFARANDPAARWRAALSWPKPGGYSPSAVRRGNKAIPA